MGKEKEWRQNTVNACVESMPVSVGGLRAVMRLRFAAQNLCERSTERAQTRESWAVSFVCSGPIQDKVNPAVGFAQLACTKQPPERRWRAFARAPQSSDRRLSPVCFQAIARWLKGRYVQVDRIHKVWVWVLSRKGSTLSQITQCGDEGFGAVCQQRHHRNGLTGGGRKTKHKLSSSFAEAAGGE